jgi:hypothetical protein
MKRTLIFILTVLVNATISGQTTEISEQLSSGLFYFGGPYSVKTSVIRSINNLDNNYTDNPYGRFSGFSYVLGLKVQRITKSNFIFGLQSSFESLSSKVKVTNVLTQSVHISDAKTILINQFLSFHPFLGKRIKLINLITSDLTFGTDLGIDLNIREHETGTLDNMSKYDFFYTNLNKPRSIDIRPRIEFINYYKKFGLTIGYSYGLTNYTNKMVSGNMEAFSRMIRFGLAYIF